jgi:cysteine synthase A
MNPLSLKDRPVLQIIEDAKRSGRLKPGSTLIEATSGNTGVAVAYIAAIKGYRAILVMSEIQNVERRKVLRAFGAELVLTPASEGTARGGRSKKSWPNTPSVSTWGSTSTPPTPGPITRASAPRSGRTPTAG